MLFFLVCADEAKAMAEGAARGWTQVGVARFYTPDRDDVRVVRRFTDVGLLPGGTWLMAAADYMCNPERGEFDGFVAKGAARWVTGEEPRDLPEEPPEEVLGPEEAARELFNPAMAKIMAAKDGWPPRTAPEVLVGGPRGPRPSRR
jgi:hypothetical protein